MLKKLKGFETKGPESCEARELLARLADEEISLEEKKRFIKKLCAPWNVLLGFLDPSKHFRPVKHIEDMLTLLVKELHDEKEKARTDHLTKTLNRRGIVHRWDTYHRDGNESQAFLCMDLDFFKHVNDTHGHSVGDTVLAAVARRIDYTVRSDRTWTLGRHGGEEFVVILLGFDEESAMSVAERIRLAIASEPIVVTEGPYLEVHMTVSIGVAMVPPAGSFGSGMHDADIALYRAKELGRNRICLYETTD